MPMSPSRVLAVLLKSTSGFSLVGKNRLLLQSPKYALLIVVKKNPAVAGFLDEITCILVSAASA